MPIKAILLSIIAVAALTVAFLVNTGSAGLDLLLIIVCFIVALIGGLLVVRPHQPQQSHECRNLEYLEPDIRQYFHN